MKARRLGFSLRVAVTSTGWHTYGTSHGDKAQLPFSERLLLAMAKITASTGTSSRLA
jgi:hypothetical protein